MLFNLVKKDFILVKKYLIILLATAIIAPIFISYNLRPYGSTYFAFAMTVLLLEYICFGTISMADDKFKGSSLLCTTPYTRSKLVIAKYLLILTIFLVSSVLYAIISLVLPSVIPTLTLLNYEIILLIIATFFSIVIPVQFKFGFIKTKNILTTIVCILPLIAPIIIKNLNSRNISFNINIPYIMQSTVVMLLTLIISAISMKISINIYSKKDL